MTGFDLVGHWTLPDEFSSAGRARALLREAVMVLAADATTREDLELVASELVANAVEHGDGPVDIRLERAPGLLQLSVASHTSGGSLPEVKPPSPEAGGGRGLALVTALSTTWGWNADGDRIVVWAQFADA